MLTVHDLFSKLVFDGQDTSLCVDGCLAKGSAGELHLMLSDMMLASKVTEINAVSDQLRVFATLKEDDHATD